MSVPIASYTDAGPMALSSCLDLIDLPMALYRVRTDGTVTILKANAAFSGYSRQGDGTPGPRLQRAIASAASAQAPVSVDERFGPPDGPRWWRTTLTRPEVSDGSVVLGLSVPATDAQGHANDLAAEICAISERFSEYRVFATMAVHDTRAPLATVAGLLDLIGEDFVDMGDGKAELLQLCVATVREALGQIGATLERARALDPGTRCPERIDIGRLTSGLLSAVDPGGRVATRLPSGVLIGDGIVLELALRNLLSNAVRHCRGRIAVDVGEDARRGMVTVHVSDDGPGLPAGFDLDALIRAARAATGVRGFGLASIAQLALARGGALELSRSPEGDALPGACFRLELPGRLERASGAAGAVQVADTG